MAKTNRNTIAHKTTEDTKDVRHKATDYPTGTIAITPSSTGGSSYWMVVGNDVYPAMRRWADLTSGWVSSARDESWLGSKAVILPEGAELTIRIGS